MRKTPRSVFLLGALLAVPALRAEPPAAEPLQFEVTPFVGYRVGGKFELIDTGQSVNVQDHGSFALALNMRAADWTQYELFYSRQASVMAAPGFPASSVKVEYLHIGGIVPLEETARVKPYFGGGLGVTRLTPDSAQGTDDTRFSLSLALGMHVPLSRQQRVILPHVPRPDEPGQHVHVPMNPIPRRLLPRRQNDLVQVRPEHAAQL